MSAQDYYYLQERDRAETERREEQREREYTWQIVASVLGVYSDDNWGLFDIDCEGEAS